MPNLSHLQAPPMLRGDAESKLQQLWTWSYQIVEQLNLLINAEESEKAVPVEADTGAVDALRVKTEKNIAGVADELNGTLERVVEGVNTTIGEVDKRVSTNTEDISVLSQSFESHDHPLPEHKHSLFDGMQDVEVRYGHEVMSKVTAGRSGTRSVTFDIPFPEGVRPYIIATPYVASGESNVGRCTLSVAPTTVSNTGFMIRFHNDNSSDHDYTPEFGYIAIGNLNERSEEPIGLYLSGEEDT